MQDRGGIFLPDSTMSYAHNLYDPIISLYVNVFDIIGLQLKTFLSGKIITYQKIV